MTEHDKLMLKRHLLAAVRLYEQRVDDLRSSHPFMEGTHSPSSSTVASGYDSLALDARRTMEALK